MTEQYDYLHMIVYWDYVCVCVCGNLSVVWFFTWVSDSIHSIDNRFQGRIVFIHNLLSLKKNVTTVERILQMIKIYR